MVNVYFKGSIELGDYFNRNGFGDGDDRVGLEAGYEYAEMAVTIINRALIMAGSKMMAETEDQGGLHNPCMIVLRLGPVEVHIGAEGDDLIPSDCYTSDGSMWKETVELMINLWPAMNAEFEKQVDIQEKIKLDGILPVESDQHGIETYEGTSTKRIASRKVWDGVERRKKK